MAASRTINGFSLIEGGPLFDLQRSAHLLGVEHDVLRRALLLLFIGWLPPVLLVAFGGAAPGSLVGLHTRFLVAIPILLWAEGFVDRRVRGAVMSFPETGLVDGNDLGRFAEIMGESEGLRDSPTAALAIGTFAFGVSLLADLTGYAHRTHAADWWMAYLSLPLFRVTLLLWLWRWIVWAILLGRISRLDLHLVPTHPDLAGGIGFLEQAAVAFLIVLVAAGAAISSELAVSAAASGSRGDWIGVLGPPLVGFAIIAGAMVIGPLLFFAPKIRRAKRLGQLQYGALAYRHNRLFAEKWIRGGGRGQHLLGDPSISSLADIGQSFGFVAQMRVVPFGRHSLLWLAIVTVAPAVPVVLQRIPLDQMITRVVKGLLL
jgi:hypothetical protein